MEEVSIGEFARRSRWSVKALRLYDELGVLVPARVDKAKNTSWATCAFGSGLGSNGEPLDGFVLGPSPVSLIAP